jgi:hypothetical protein
MCNNNIPRFDENHWEQYRILIKYLRHTCSYLDRQYIREAYCGRKKQMYQMFIVSCEHFPLFSPKRFNNHLVLHLTLANNYWCIA